MPPKQEAVGARWMLPRVDRDNTKAADAMRAGDLSEAVRRYAILRDRAADLHAAFVELGGRADHLRDRVARTQLALDVACRPWIAEADDAGLAYRRGHRGGERERAPNLDTFAADVAAAKKALAEVDARRSAITRERAPIAGLAGKCREHLERLGWKEPRL